MIADDNRICTVIVRISGDQIIGGDSVLRKSWRWCDSIHDGHPVLLRGETGVGKDPSPTQSIHIAAPDGPFNKVNCGSIPKHSWTASFSARKGRVHGAVARRRGEHRAGESRYHILDEIGELPMAAQVGCSCPQNKEIHRIGGSMTTSVEPLRVIAATHRNLEENVDRMLPGDHWFA